LHVVLVRSVVPHAVASDEVVSGVREELAREGALAAGDGYPRVEIEVLRVDETSDAIAAAHPVAGGRAVPAARATEVGVVARAWIVETRGADPVRDTGDVRALDLVGLADIGGTAGTTGTIVGASSLDGPSGATAPGASARDAIRHESAARAAARRVGERL